MTGIDRNALRAAFGRFLTGVTVVTTVDGQGTPLGFTANSFTSVSLDPPLLLVCPGRFLSSFPVFEHCQHFAISILAEDQEEIANIFASHAGDRFGRTPWRPDRQGVPVIHDAAAYFSCKTANVIPAGDHVILLGEILDVGQSGKRGLGYGAGQYFSPGPERAAAAAPQPGRRAFAGALIEHEGKVLLEQTPDGLRPPRFSLDGRVQAREAISEHLGKTGLEIVPGQAYAIFDDRHAGAHYTWFRARALSDATGGLGQYLPIAGLPAMRFASRAHATMLSRYALEHRTRRFALYVGDESSGDIYSPGERS